MLWSILYSIICCFQKIPMFTVKSKKNSIFNNLKKCIGPGMVAYFLIPELRRYKQAALSHFKTSMAYIVRPLLNKQTTTKLHILLHNWQNSRHKTKTENKGVLVWANSSCIRREDEGRRNGIILWDYQKAFVNSCKHIKF